MTRARLTIAAAALLCLSGCIARTAIDIAKLPVKAAGAAVDLATTSRSEADERRGRELRERDEQLGMLERRRLKLAEECGEGDEDACAERDEVNAEIESLLAAPIGGRDRGG